MLTGSLNVTCNGANDGSINVVASGGTGVLQYSIDGFTYVLSNNFTGLGGGIYTVYVKDAHGCIVSNEVTITEPAALSILGTWTNVTCAGGNDGVINLTVFGGTGPFWFMWSNGETSEDIFHLAAGTYSVTVTDESGCDQIGSYTITQPTNPLIVNGTVTDASSSTTSDGDIDITINGGTGPYTFLWSNGTTTEDLHHVLPGLYTVIVTDNYGCATSSSFVIGFSTGVAGGNYDSLKVAKCLVI